MKFLGEYKKKYPINNPEQLKNLWDVCRIPDFQNISDEKHLILLASVYGELSVNNWKLTENFLSFNIKKLEEISPLCPRSSLSANSMIEFVNEL